jgi:hypothetical protein
MKSSHILPLTLVSLLMFAHSVQAGPFVTPGIPADGPFAGWATDVIDASFTSSGSAVAAAGNALGAPDGTLVSLGDLTATQIGEGAAVGQITLGFGSQFLRNGPGWDLAVFENAGTFFEPPFIFGELAYVEVSSNGIDFARFPASSLNVEPGEGDADTELIDTFGRSFAGLNTTNVHNLVGVHPQGIGTPLDLEELAAHPLIGAGLLDLNRIAVVRLVDIPGSGDFLDDAGRGILDAWPTAGTGGLDLDALGGRYLVPEPTGSGPLLMLLLASLWWRRKSKRSADC